MKVGLMLNTEYPETDDPARRFAEHREQVRLTREAGFDLVGIPHHYSRGPSQWFPPLLTAAALAGEAGSMRVATTVFLLPLVHPVEVAEQAAMLDVLCGGRFVFGVGSGWQPDEFKALGVPLEERAGRLEEGLDLVQRLWTGEPVAFRGRHYAVDARLADSWIVSSRPDIASVERHLETYRRA